MDHGVPVEEAVKQIFIVGYLQFVERKNLNAAVCLAEYGAAPVANKPHRKALSFAHTATSRVLETMQNTSDLIMADWRITTDEVQGESDLGWAAPVIIHKSLKIF